MQSAHRDPQVLGDFAEELCPGRALPRGVAPQLLAFGEGPPRCPGGPLAMRETEVLLAAMLRRPDLEVLSNPEFGRNESVKGYEVRHLRLRLGHAGC